MNACARSSAWSRFFSPVRADATSGPEVEKYAHIEQEEKDKVTAECDRVSAQLDTKLSEQVRNASPPRDSAFPIGSVAEARLSAQDALAKTVPPCVTTMEIKAFVSRERASDPCARVAET